MSLTDWSITPLNNSTKPGITWVEGMAPRDINNSARQMMADLAALTGVGGAALIGTPAGTVAARLTAGDAANASNAAAILAFQGTLTSGRLGYTTYAALAANITAAAGTLAEVPLTDAGTHADPVVGGVVNNTGVFRWSASPAGWERLYSTEAASAIPYRDQAAASAAAAAALLAPAALAAGREAAELAALASTGWDKVVYQDSDAPANAPGANGEIWLAFDAGTDMAVGTVIDALEAAISVGATATQIIARVWSVATADANVNSGPAQANDVLISTVTVSALSGVEAFDGGVNGVTPNAAERNYVFPLQAPFVVAAATTYKISLKALDAVATEVAINTGTRQLSAPTGRQRRNGGTRNPAGAGAFTNRNTLFIPSIGLLTRRLSSSSVAAATVAANTAALAAISQDRLAWSKQANDTALEAQSAAYSKVMPDALTFSGDSLEAAFGSSIPPSAIVADFVTATVNNVAVSGTRADQIATTFLALPAGQQNDYGISNGGTNDITQGASSVLSATITTGGSGGVDGSYTIPTTGGAGATLVQASLTATVAGGVLTALTVAANGGGGGFTTAPTPNFAAIGFAVAPVVVLNLDLIASIQYNINRLMAAAGANRAIMSPWVSGTAGVKAWAQARRIAAWEKATFGARAFDALPFWSKWHGGTESDLADVRRGSISLSLTADGLHQDDRGVGIIGREHARVARALPGTVGPAYIHDDLVGARNGDAVGTAITTLRALGTPKGFQVVKGNAVDAVLLNATTGAITRGAATLPAINELYVQADGLRRGRSNIARVTVVRQMDGTSPQSAVRLAVQGTGNAFGNGNGAGVLTTDKLTGGVAGKKMTFVVCARFNDIVQGTLLGTNISTQITKQGKTLRAVLFTAAGALIATSFFPTAVDPFDYNFYFLSLDTTGGVQTLAVTVNEMTALTAVPAADTLYPFDALTNLFFSAGSYLGNFDIKMMWQAPDYIDITDPTKRALFYNPTTRAPLDLGAAGTVNGKTPIIYTRGMAGDYLLGKNYGTGGDFFVPPFVNAANVGFVDVT